MVNSKIDFLNNLYNERGLSTFDKNPVKDLQQKTF